MQVFEFPCPHCGVKLRLKDRGLAGRTTKCPDCRRPMSIGLSEQGQLVGIAPGDEAIPPDKTVTPPTAGRSWSLWLRSPAGIGWVTAIVLLGTALGVLGFTSNRDADRSGDGDSRSDEPVVAKDDPPDDPTAGGGNTTADSLAALAALIRDYESAHGHYPRSTVDGALDDAARRLSWLAALAAEDPEGAALQPQWDRPWNDPLNDRFARRRIEAFQNPAVNVLVSPEGFPAGHFVGIAGVGVDAAALPKTDPRAGIFGTDRTTRIDDIKDGTANTMMVAGVQSRIGSWAAGPSTVRAFTKEPYINGPDGFGSGQPNGMHVMMADGSVRFLAADVDPVIVRRMAAMADGLPLDASVPGEPGDPIESEPMPPVVANVGEDPPPPPPNGDAANDPLADEPITVLMAPDIDVEAALAQPILEFVQMTPVEALVLIRQIEELAGVPIDLSGVSNDPGVAERLSAKIQIKLGETNVGEILKAALGECGLDFERTETGVVVVNGRGDL